MSNLWPESGREMALRPNLSLRRGLGGGQKVYHYRQHDYRTELYYFRVLFGNSCSVIAERICFWNSLVSVSSVSRGLPSPLPNLLAGIIFDNFGGGITEPKLFWNSSGNLAISLAIYRSHSGPSGPEIPKSRKKVHGASWPRGQKKAEKRSRKG